MAAPVDPATRKKVLRVVFFSLLLDLVCALAPTMNAIGRIAWLIMEHRSVLLSFSHYFRLCWHIIESKDFFLASICRTNADILLPASKHPHNSAAQINRPLYSRISLHTSMPTRLRSRDLSIRDMILCY